jgi:PPOX class probable FMN-dependent enzyme
LKKITYQETIKSVNELQSMLGYPSEMVKNKSISYIDHHCKDFIAKSPFLVLSTSDNEGYCDVSPRGDLPGFVHVLNDTQLVIPERPGNKRMDSMRNILSNPRVGLIFVIPGLGETLRVNGQAKLIKDTQILESMAVKGKTPLVGIAVDVDECFIHCAKAFIRSGLWDPSTWQEKGLLPSVATIISDHVNLPNTTAKAVEERLKESYRDRLY